MDRHNLEVSLNFLKEETELDFIKDINSQLKPNAFTVVLEYYIKTVKINFSLN
jgi:hypothetical protein